MNKYLLSSLCLFALNNANADSQPLTLPTGTISAPAMDDENVSLTTPTTAGSRLNLTAMETPASVESLSGEQVRARGDRSVQDGVSRSTGISRTWSVERIDVLRGPASVLYGEGATGAVVNVIPKKPFEGDIENHLRLGYGSYDRQQQAFDSGGSLSDTLSYRLNLNRLRSNGWVDRGDSSGDFISAALRWQATDDLAFTLAHDYGDQRPQNDFGTPLINGQLKDSLRYKNYNVRDDQQHYNDQWTRLTTDWQINNAVSASNELYYLKARRRWQNAENYNFDTATQQLSRSGYFGIGHQQEQVGDRQTFTFKHSLFGLDSQTVTGVDYNRIRFQLNSNSPFNDVLPNGQALDLYHPQPGYFESANPYRDQFDSTTKQMSVFGENRTQLSERWSLVTGVRRDYVQVDRNNLVDDSQSDKTLTGNNWKAGLVFALTPETSFYAQVATSTDGIGGLISLSPSQQQYDLSTARQTEVGLKQLFWDQRGEFTLAAYRIVKKKLLTDDPGNPTLKQQVGQQSSNGFEASLDLQLPHAWQLQANAAIVKAKYDDFSEVVNGQTLSYNGNRPVDVPRRTANLWLNKNLSDDLKAGAGVRYVDARYADMANRNELPSYTVVDATLSWQALRNTTLGLQLNNLFDRRYAQSQYNDGQQWILGEPRSFFVTADYTF